jgi:hypothetical protein
MTKFRWLRALVAMVALLLPASAAHAAATSWTQITPATEGNTDEVSVARTADGNLHVVWTRPTPSPGSDLLETPIAPSGVVGASGLIASNWASFLNPAVVASSSYGLDVFVGGIHSIAPGDPHVNLSQFSSTDGGATWTLYPSDLTNTGSAYASDASAALGAGGNPFVTWGSSACLCVHIGLAAATPNANFQSGLGDFGYEPGIAVDRASGQMVVAWYSNGTGHTGIYADGINQSTGQPTGAPALMPGTSDILAGPYSGRTPIAARAGGGLYVAYSNGYPAHTQLLLWRVGTGASTVLEHSSAEVNSVGVAADPSGRLWVFWSTTPSTTDTPIVFARRSNPSVTAWGATVTVKPPAGASTSWNLVGDGQAGRLDLLGSFSLGTSSTAATWATQVLPGLTLSASPSLLHTGAKHATAVTFTVSDAGQPVKGALVHAGHVHGSTNAKGKLTLKLGPFKHRTSLTASVSDNGYVGASLRLTVH